MISIVVPVYNVELYLKRCVDSILNQSYTDFEIILVDDGSKDNSGKLCDEYQNKDIRIKVIHQQNGGLSVARNTGIQAASGEYITYVDSDDIIHHDYLKILKYLIDKYNSNISCCNFKFFYEESELIEDISLDYKDYCISGETATEKMLYGQFHGSSACAILMEIDIARKNLFTPKKYHEDDLVTFKYYYSAEKVSYTEMPLYFYFQRTGSIMHSKYGQPALDEIAAGDYIYTESLKYSKQIQKAALFKKFQNYIDVIKTYPELKSLDSTTYTLIKNELKKLTVYVYLNKKVSKKNRLIAFILKFFGIKTFLKIKL